MQCLFSSGRAQPDENADNTRPSFTPHIRTFQNPGPLVFSLTRSNAVLAVM